MEPLFKNFDSGTFIQNFDSWTFVQQFFQTFFKTLTVEHFFKTLTVECLFSCFIFSHVNLKRRSIVFHTPFPLYNLRFWLLRHGRLTETEQADWPIWNAKCRWTGLLHHYYYHDDFSATKRTSKGTLAPSFLPSQSCSISKRVKLVFFSYDRKIIQWDHNGWHIWALIFETAETPSRQNRNQTDQKSLTMKQNLWLAEQVTWIKWRPIIVFKAALTLSSRAVSFLKSMESQLGGSDQPLKSHDFVAFLKRCKKNNHTTFRHDTDWFKKSKV